MYTVSQAAALTGIPTATLRAWERRYGVIEPTRTEGGYRLYNATQIALLREMVARIEGGMRPAQAAASLAGPRKRAGSLGDPDLVAAAASLDPARLQATIEEAFAASAFEVVVTTWLLPQLRALGEAWADGRVSVAQEHFASAGLMTAVASKFAETVADPNGATVLVGLPAGARHQLALYAFATCLRRLGLNVLYLGADLPAEEWLSAARVQRPRAAVLGAHSPRDAAAGGLVVEALAGSSIPVWVGGATANEVQGATPLPDDPPEAARQLHRILRDQRT